MNTSKSRQEFKLIFSFCDLKNNTDLDDEDSNRAFMEVLEMIDSISNAESFL